MNIEYLRDETLKEMFSICDTLGNEINTSLRFHFTPVWS